MLPCRAWAVQDRSYDHSPNFNLKANPHSIWRRYTDQMQVVAHMVLANLQDDVQLLLCDPDEYLALDAPMSLADVFDDCLLVGFRLGFGLE